MPDEEKLRRMENYFEKQKFLAEKENQFFSEMTNAEELLKKGDYDGAIEIYKKLIPIAEEMGWHDKNTMLKEMITSTREKKEQEKIKQEKLKKMELSRLKRESIYNEALDLMGQASEEYNRKNLEKALELYEKSLDLLRKINSRREIEVVNDSIVKIRREIEESVKRLDKAFQSNLQASAAYSETLPRKSSADEKKLRELERMRRYQEEKEREKRIVDDAMKLLDKANVLLREAKSMNYASVEAKEERYIEVIHLYESAADKFREIGWNDEMQRVKDTIIQVKKEKNADCERLAKILQERKEIQKFKQMMAEPEPETRKVDPRILKEKQEKKALQEKAFEALDVASKALEEFERKPTVIGGQIFKDNEYPEIIRLYTKALGYFKELGWANEAAKIEESLVIIRKKEKDFLAEKESFEKRQAAEGKAMEGSASGVDARTTRYLASLKKREAIKEREASKNKEREMREKVDEILGEAMKHYKRNDYAKSEQYYREAMKLMLELGWDSEANSVADTIHMLEEKRAKRETLLMQKERAVDESGAFTRGIEQISETQSFLQKQEELAKRSELKKHQESIAKKKEMEERFYDVLSKAQENMKKRAYHDAVIAFQEALKLAEDLKWASQVRDIGGFLREARELEKKSGDIQVDAGETAQGGIESGEPVTIASVKKAEAMKTRLELRKQQKQKEEELVDLLSTAQLAAKNKDYDVAIKIYTDALEIAESLNWASQVNDIKDLIRETREKKEEAMKVAEIKASTPVPLETTTPETEGVKEGEKGAAPVLTPAMAKKLREKELGEQAYALIDEGNALEKENDKEGAIEKFTEAMKLFEEIGWTRERDAVQQQIKNVEQKIKDELAFEARRRETEKTREAYNIIDEAEKLLRNKEFEAAIEKYKMAHAIFKSVNWEKESLMMEKQIEKVTQQMEEKLIADKTASDKAKIEQAYQWLEKARQMQRERKIFKAVEYANDALNIFLFMGSDWARETAEVQKFVEELEEEKRRKEELIKKLKRGDF